MPPTAPDDDFWRHREATELYEILKKPDDGALKQMDVLEETLQSEPIQLLRKSYRFVIPHFKSILLERMLRRGELVLNQYIFIMHLHFSLYSFNSIIILVYRYF